MKTLLTTFIFVFFSLSANAEKLPFTETLYQEYQNNNETFLVDVFATWCPTCKKQSQIINQYFKENPNSNIKVLVVDYDDQKDWVTHFRAPRQSTLLIYKGKEQLWFSVAETNKDKIFSALKQAEE
ncbi:thioredoxin family protein [Thalassotalea sp. PP2-459]|uniref:thioredoxin family protein n=1 Tax=Thalassotalea sp. PP2-459 TaxID=1742724 RepID=UPI000944BFE4|nr:thioredoxin family protein [Thalassotalea sp. PP2-459]OKY25595.1 thiol reductase thioredoxin [Thalassotalea sp. PP2-459]